MTTNIYESLRLMLEYAIGYLDIVPDGDTGKETIAAVQQMLDAYDALAPDWSQAPDWAQWYTVDSDNEMCFHEFEPTVHATGFWYPADGERLSVGFGVLSRGIDWRECKWQRPQSGTQAP